MSKITLKDLTSVPVAALMLAWPIILIMIAVACVVGSVGWLIWGTAYVPWLVWSAIVGTILGWAIACIAVMSYNVQ